MKVVGSETGDGGAAAVEQETLAAYVEDMSRELISLTEAANLRMLSYLLDLVREEAAQLRRPDGGAALL